MLSAGMRYDFLIDTYRTEREKTLGVWSMFHEADMRVRPRLADPRGRSLIDHLIHQCLSENAWFAKMLDIEVTVQPIPPEETRTAFIVQYAADSAARLDALERTDAAWWETVVPFFATPRSRAWIVVRRIAHTAHHRGQQTALLRMLGRDLHSTYGPTADTGGLPTNGAQVIYPYPDVATLLHEETVGTRAKAPLPGLGERRVTER